MKQFCLSRFIVSFSCFISYKPDILSTLALYVSDISAGFHIKLFMQHKPETMYKKKISHDLVHTPCYICEKGLNLCLLKSIKEDFKHTIYFNVKMLGIVTFCTFEVINWNKPGFLTYFVMRTSWLLTPLKFVSEEKRLWKINLVAHYFIEPNEAESMKAQAR